jgi:hypothetical protein
METADRKLKMTKLRQYREEAKELGLSLQEYLLLEVADSMDNMEQDIEAILSELEEVVSLGKAELLRH